MTDEIEINSGINAKSVGIDLIHLTFLAAQKQGVRVISDGLLEGGHDLLSVANRGQLFVGFEGDESALKKVEDRFNSLRRLFQDDRIPDVMDTVRVTTPEEKKLLFVDISPLLDAPDALHKIVTTEARRNMLKAFTSGMLISLVGSGLHVDFYVNGPGRNMPVNLAELLSGGAMEIAGSLRMREALRNEGLPSELAQMKMTNDYITFFASVLTKVEDYYKQKGMLIDNSMPESGIPRLR